MPGIRSATVNLCPADEALWQLDGGEGRPRLRLPGVGAGSPLTISFSDPATCRCAPRHIEPERPYLLECDVKGRGRIGLAWVREGRPLKGADAGQPTERRVWSSPDGTPRFDQLAEVSYIWSERFDAPDWQRVTVGGISPVVANRVQVVLQGDGETSFDYPYLDGLGAIPVEVILPAGFHANGSKVAVIAARERAQGGRFELLSGEQVVHSGHLIRWGEYVWGREYWNADFSGVERPGRYRLRVALADGHQAESPEFEISSDIYLSLPNLTLGWYYTQRCGVEIPGWHQACHLDDALIGRTHNRRLGPGGEWTITGEADLTGGWHDAGDNHKYICWSYLALWALARLHRVEPSELRNLGEVLPDPLSEACWEARFLLKTVSPEGLFPLGVISRYRVGECAPPRGDGQHPEQRG